jgi:methanogenic corrinoid protein MtbC1
VLYLGPDVPVESWVHVIEQKRARMAVLSVVQVVDRKPAIEVATALQALVRRPTLAVGGGSSVWAGAEEAGIVLLPSRIIEAAAAAAALVNAARTTD